MIKTMSINTEISFDKLMTLVERVDSIAKAEIAEEWIKGNKVITDTEVYTLLMKVYFQKAVIFNKLRKASLDK